MSNSKLYLIQGIIFQEGYVFGLGNKPGIGTAVTIQQAMNFAICNGIVGPNEGNPETYFGSMKDLWGDSEISDFVLTENELKFSKCYKNRSHIEYVFDKKVGNVWYGKYSGQDCGEGTSKCIITEIDQSFLEPQK